VGGPAGSAVGGGFALVTGAPGCGRSAILRILAASLATQRDVSVGVISRPKANVADFYREMGELFGVELRPHNRFAGAKILRQRWQAHIQSTLRRPVLVIDEAQEMQTAVLAELRLLASTDLDSNILLTVVLAGDGRLVEPSEMTEADAALPTRPKPARAFASDSSHQGQRIRFPRQQTDRHSPDPAEYQPAVAALATLAFISQRRRNLQARRTTLPFPMLRIVSNLLATGSLGQDCWINDQLKS
jgi:hypothetical protein